MKNAEWIIKSSSPRLNQRVQLRDHGRQVGVEVEQLDRAGVGTHAGDGVRAEVESEKLRVENFIVLLR